MNCPKCHTDNPDTSRFCGNCATPLGDLGGAGFSVTRTLERSAQAAAPGAIVAEKYRIIEEIGRGGMGIVYRAEDVKLNRLVALKFLPPQWTSDMEARERFIHEARAASALDHQNICNIHEIGETEDRRMFIAMACYEGDSLREKIKRGPLKTDEAIGIAIQVAQGMAKAHQKGIIHRDIKPANILITNDGVAKIVDFGLAKLAGQARLTKEGSTVGTAAYMSPEQVKGEAVDQRTDIWSLGVLLYEMVTGRLPFKGDLEQSLVHSILTSDPEPTAKTRKDLPRGLENVIIKCLLKNPPARYQSMDELAEDLKAVAEGLKPLKAKLGLFRGRIFGIKCGYVYAGLSCLAILALWLLVGPSVHVKVYDSIAVLPLDNLSRDSGQDIYSLGLASELIARLYSIPDFQVLQLNLVKNFRTAKKSYKDLWQEYHVKAVLDADFLRVGGRVRIIPKLIDTETGRLIWTRPYERIEADIIALQADIAQAIVREIQASLSPQQKGQLAFSARVVPAAYEAYLQGKEACGAMITTEEQAQSVLGFFQKAIELDPIFASPYWALVIRYYHQVHAISLIPFDEVVQKAEAAISKGLSLDPYSYEAHLAQGIVLWWKWEWEGALGQFKRAIELSPGDMLANARYTDILHAVGRVDEALAHWQRVVDVDLTGNYAMRLGLISLMIDAKKLDEALSLSLELARQHPDIAEIRHILAQAYAYKGKWTEAIAEATKSLALLTTSEKTLTHLNNAIVYAMAGRREDAIRILDEYLAYKRGKVVDSYTISELYSVLDDKEEAFKWLERAIEGRDFWMIWLKVDPAMENIRSDPRFKEYLRRAGFEK